MKPLTDCLRDILSNRPAKYKESSHSDDLVTILLRDYDGFTKNLYGRIKVLEELIGELHENSDWKK